MPPRPSFGLKIVTDVDQLPQPPAQPNPRAHDTAAWEVKADGSYAMLGKSLRGEYVFNQQGLIKSSGQDAGLVSKVSEEELILMKPLGAGACAQVYKGYHHGLRKLVAVKRVNFTNKDMRQQMLRDIKILLEAQAVPGLLSFLGAYLVPQKDQIGIVLEYMDGGTLADVLKKLGRIPEDVLAQITGKILQGLLFMHAKHMVHRDIKPANILMSRSGEAKLSDFGISALTDGTLAQCETYTGTVTYMSPERLEHKPYNFKADIWSLGMVLVECLTGHYPFEAAATGGGPMELIIHVLQDDVPLPAPGTVSEACRDFLAACLAKDPSRRPPAGALLAHPWIAQAAAVNLKGVLGQLAYDTSERLEEVAVVFAFTYYELLSRGDAASLEKLAYLYLEHSLLSYQGEVRQGRQAIATTLQAVTAQQQQQQGCSSGPGRPVWNVGSVDSQPVCGIRDCILVHVMGSIQQQGTSQPPIGAAAAAAGLKFTESFILNPSDSGNYYIANQTFRLMP